MVNKLWHSRFVEQRLTESATKYWCVDRSSYVVSLRALRWKNDFCTDCMPIRIRIKGGVEFAGPKNVGPQKEWLEIATPGKWWTKSQPWNLQDLENEEPNRRGWKMQDLWAFALLHKLCRSCGEHAKWLPSLQNPHRARSACIHVTWKIYRS